MKTLNTTGHAVLARFAQPREWAREQELDDGVSFCISATLEVAPFVRLLDVVTCVPH